MTIEQELIEAQRALIEACRELQRRPTVEEYQRLLQVEKCYLRRRASEKLENDLHKETILRKLRVAPKSVRPTAAQRRYVLRVLEEVLP